MGRLIYPSGIAAVPRITQWNGELLRLRLEHLIFMSSRVLAKRMLSPLLPSIRTLLSLTVRTMGSSTKGISLRNILWMVRVGESDRQFT